MRLYSERNNLRSNVKKTYVISRDMYKIIFDCCNKYLENLAWKYPAFCPDNKGSICGLDFVTFYANLKFDIPDLYRREYSSIDSPDVPGNHDDYNQYALLDYIELIAKNIKDIKERDYHSYFNHYELTFSDEDDCEIFIKYLDEINEIFKKTGLLYVLNGYCEIERVVENDIVTPEIENAAENVSEKGTKELLREAIRLFRNPRPESQHLAVEKVWDAFERLKSYYLPTLDKMESANKIIYDMSDGNAAFITLFTTEFQALTKIGNNYRIRHHEVGKNEITDHEHYDYLFNRCMSLIALAIKYLH